MSNTFETCNICGSNDWIQLCANCGTKCCKKCYELHDASVCSYIKDSKCHLCEIHSELPNSVTGYCFQCQHLVCELCQTIEVHDDHSIVGLTEALFIVQSEQYTESDEKRSFDMTSDTKKLLETLTIQIENQCKKIVDCISERKCKLLSELNEHKQYLEEYATEMERAIQSVREKMSEFKTSRAVFPLLFLHKWQTFAKQMNKLEKPADRLTFLCGLINIYNLDEQFGKLQNAHPQKGMIDEEVDKLASDDAFKVKDTDMVSSQYNKILTQNESLKREVVGLKSEQETSKTEISYMIQLSEETCQFVKDCNNKLEDSRFHFKAKQISQLKVKASDAWKEKQKLYDTIEKQQKEHNKEIEYLNSKIKNQSDLLKQVQSEKNRIDEENRQTREQTKTTVKEKEENILQLKEEIKGHQVRFKDYTNKLSQCETERMNLRQILKEKKENIKYLIQEKDELQTRLSSIAGEKLSKGNPTITDLGDPNRPMKIGDKYGELYDNEWTDAMESINDIKSFYSVSEHIDIEEVIVLHLCQLLKICYNECLSLADEQIDNIGKIISETLCLNVNSRSDFYNFPACKDVVVQRRQKSDHFVKHLLANEIIGKTAMHDWEYVNKNGDVMEYLMKTPFFDQCVNLCWCMVIQDPVMYLDGDITQGTTFDKNTYKEFVKSGNKVKYVVWPALFLHKDGPLLHKGTIQAYWDLN
ncbi:Hypothetical predicted protein [Mytilus galloprovincialis]|uniref:B box-type domain-containing protein n=1 Tax=Mytilus galloprovincialis TaxID=29158 RepID=A0A8B6CD21_MYTGA|nr:Hypothetical predicted protein [Mytilus galloprovincialis]